MIDYQAQTAIQAKMPYPEDIMAAAWSDNAQAGVWLEKAMACSPWVWRVVRFTCHNPAAWPDCYLKTSTDIAVVPPSATKPSAGLADAWDAYHSALETLQQDDEHGVQLEMF